MSSGRPGPPRAQNAEMRVLEERDVALDLAFCRLACSWLSPKDARGAVVLAGGTLSETRDGGFLRPGAPPRDALRRLAGALAEAGWAVLRYDRPGYGESTTYPGFRNCYHEQAAALAAAMEWASAEVAGPLVVAGESAGAYAACLAAADRATADGYVLLGAFCGTSADLYRYNFGRLYDYAHSSEERMEWALRTCPFDLALGACWREMLEAAERGEQEYEVVGQGICVCLGLHRRREELRWPPREMFAHLQAPALALAGEFDLNVPPEHAAEAAGLMRAAGNGSAVSRIIAGADHSFQVSDDDEDVRFRQRYSWECLRQPYCQKMYKVVAEWVNKMAPA